jgi:hypothetical protein
VKGLSISENALDFTVIRLHYSADPAKDPATEAGLKWYETTKRLFPDPIKWEQEFEINWWVAAGTRVYPEFNESQHCLDVDGYRARKPIYRAWDFGWHAPACLIAQIDSKDRLVILKEVVGNQETTRDFAKKVIEKCSAWFPAHGQYRDFCDPAGQMHNSTASEKSEARDVEILQNLGIHPSWEWGWNRKDGRSLVHQLLVLRIDGTPGLYVVPSGAPVLLQGFLGKYVYPPKKGGTAHDEPDEGNHPWSDIHACLRYLCTGLYSSLGLRRPGAQPLSAPAEVAYHGYGTPKRR